MVLDLTVGVDPAKVAGAVDAAGWVVLDAEEVGDEHLLGQVGPIQVAGGQPDPGDADLSHLPARKCSGLVRVEDHGGIRGQWDTQGYRPVGMDRRPGRGNRGLGGPVDVEEPATRTVPSGDELLRARLPGHEEEAQARQVFVESGEERRNAAHGGDPLALQELRQLGA